MELDNTSLRFIWFALTLKNDIIHDKVVLFSQFRLYIQVDPQAKEVTWLGQILPETYWKVSLIYIYLTDPV